MAPNDRDETNFAVAPALVADELRVEPDELDDPAVAERLDETRREAEPMTTLDPQALIRQVFGPGHSFVRGWAPKSAGIDPISGFAGHSGVDVAAAKGTPVFALSGGTVDFAGDGGAHDPSSWSSAARKAAVNGGGLTVSMGVPGLKFQYAHLSGIAVREGQAVNPGDLIGYVGSTGISTGPHLLFVVREGPGAGTAIDPLPFLAGLASSGWSPYSGAGAYQAALAANQRQAQAATAATNAALRGGAAGAAPKAAPKAAAPVGPSTGLSTELVVVGLVLLALIMVVLLAGPRGSEQAK